MTTPSHATRMEIVEQLRRLGETDNRWHPATSGMSSASVWRVGGLAVRCWGRAAEVDQSRIESIAATLNAAHAAGAEAVAAPLRWPGGEWLWRTAEGRLFEVAPWRSGRPPTGRRQIAVALKALRCLHKALARVEPPTTGASPALRERIDRLQFLALRQVNLRPEHAVQQALAEALAERLPRAAELARAQVAPLVNRLLPLQRVHGDARPEHFLLTGDQLTGVIDFGAMRFDTPWLDVARLLGEADAHDLSDGLAPAERQVVLALESSGAVLAAQNWLGWLSPGGPEGGLDPGVVAKRLGRLRGRLDRLIAGAVCENG